MEQLLPKARLVWAIRRGMLELDLIFGPFFEHEYPKLSDELKLAFQQLLSCPDQKLFDWLVKKQPVLDEQYQAIVERILSDD